MGDEEPAASVRERKRGSCAQWWPVVAAATDCGQLWAAATDCGQPWAAATDCGQLRPAARKAQNNHPPCTDLVEDVKVAEGPTLELAHHKIGILPVCGRHAVVLLLIVVIRAETGRERWAV